MFIMNANSDQIINTDFVERFCIVQKDDATLIVLSYCSDRPPVTLARYQRKEQAQEELCELFSAISEERPYFFMRGDLGIEPIKKDARTKRKGGS